MLHNLPKVQRGQSVSFYFMFVVIFATDPSIRSSPEYQSNGSESRSRTGRERYSFAFTFPDGLIVTVVPELQATGGKPTSKHTPSRENRATRPKGSSLLVYLIILTDNENSIAQATDPYRY